MNRRNVEADPSQSKAAPPRCVAGHDVWARTFQGRDPVWMPLEARTESRGGLCVFRAGLVRPQAGMMPREDRQWATQVGRLIR